MKKVKAFRDITDHEAVVYCDDRDVDYTLQPRDRASILIGLKEGYECASEGCGIISATSKRDAIQKVNQIIKTHNIMSKEEQEYINNLKEDILGVIRNLHEVSDNIDVLVEHIGHVKAVKATCEDVEHTFTARHALEDF